MQKSSNNIDAAISQLRSVAQFYLHVGPVGRAGYPVEAGDGELVAGMVGEMLFVGDVDDIGLRIFPHYVPGPSAQAQPLALANGVEPVALVRPQKAPRFAFADIAGALTQMAGDKVAVADFAQKTNPLTVFAVLGRQTVAGGQLPHLGFAQMANGEQGSGQLGLGEVGKEIGLVLDRIGGALEQEAVAFLFDAGVVARGYFVVGGIDAVVKGAEFDPLVAKDIRAGGAPGLQFGQGVGDHLVEVFGLQGDNLQGHV